MNFFFIAIAALALPALTIALRWAVLTLVRRSRRREEPVRVSVVMRPAPRVQIEELQPCVYSWADGESDGLPFPWEQDLLLRRN